MKSSLGDGGPFAKRASTARQMARAAKNTMPPFIALDGDKEPFSQKQGMKMDGAARQSGQDGGFSPSWFLFGLNCLNSSFCFRTFSDFSDNRCYVVQHET